MKSKIYYILILGLLFLHPRYMRALEPKQGSFSFHSLSKMQQQPAVAGSSQNSNSFFSADVVVDHDISTDVDVDDDDDVSFSARKKISFEDTVGFISAQYVLKRFSNISPGKYRSSYFYHNPSFYFISLRVFRL